METIAYGALVNAVLASILAVGVLCVTYAWRNPFIARSLWLVVLLKLVVPPLIAVPVPWPGTYGVEQARIRAEVTSPSRGLTHARTPIDVNGAVGTLIRSETTKRGAGSGASSRHGVVRIRRPSTLFFIGNIWLSGSVCVAGIAIARIRRFHKLTQQTRPAPNATQECARDIAVHIGLPTVPQIRLVNSKVPPLVWPIGKQPIILLPMLLLRQLGHEKAAVVLAHELIHVRRRDGWARWLELLVVSVYWWHPVAWFGRYKVQQAEERCCDAEVMKVFPAKRKLYAEAILLTLDFLTPTRETPALATGFATRSLLKRRFEMIVKGQPPERPVRLIRLCITAVGIASILTLPLPTSTAQTERQPSNTMGPGVRCTVTLKDGRRIEGQIVVANDSRIVIRRTEGPKQRRRAKLESIARQNVHYDEVWELNIKDCLDVAFRNNPSFRIVSGGRQTDGSRTRIAWSNDAESDDARLQDAVEAIIADVEQAYWRLWLAYRQLDAAKTGRDKALIIFRQMNAVCGSGEGVPEDEAQSREQYFFFRSRVEDALGILYQRERRLRFVLGLGAFDGRLVRPSEPPTAKEPQFRWELSHIEPKMRRELLDTFRDVLTSYEKTLVGVNRRKASHDEVVAIQAAHDAGQVSLDRLLDGQRREVEADYAHSAALSEHMLTLSRLHRTEDSLLQRYDLTVGTDR